MTALLLFALALLVRVFLVYTADIITPDGLLYIRIAKLIANGNWTGVYNEGFYSLYPFTIILFQKIFPEWETAGRMASAVFGSLAVVPLFFLFRRMFDMKIAAAGSIFFILSPRIAQYSSDVLREPLFWFLSTTALWAGWKSISDKKWYLVVLSSFFGGLAFFTRIEGIGTILILCCWAGWFFLFRERSIKRLLAFLCLFFVSFPLVFLVPAYVLKSKTGKWEIGHAVTKIPVMISKDSRAEEPATAKGSAGIDTMPGSSIYIYSFFIWEAFYKFFRSFHVVLILLFVFGIVRRKVIPYSKDEVPVLIWAGIFFIMSLSYAFKEMYVSTRHGLLMGIPALVWVSIGFFELSARIGALLSASMWGARYARRAAISLLIIICLIVLPKTLVSSSSDKVEMKKAGIYLKQASYSGKVFAVQPRINRLAFYAEAKYIDVPSVDYTSLSQFLRKADAAYLVIDEQTVDETIKGFREHAASLDLERINIPEFEKYRNYSFVLYRVKR